MKPILFNTEMVKAILDGRKTSTRRVIQENILEEFINLNWNPDENIHLLPYKIKDILYVRETWRKQIIDKNANIEIQYKADFNKEELACCGRRGGYTPCKWRSPSCMPKSAARIFLKVTDIKVQSLQNITEDEARQEGSIPMIWYQPYGTKNEGEQRYIGDIYKQRINYITGFANIWDRAVHKKENSWGSNPLVFVISFKKEFHKNKFIVKEDKNVLFNKI